MNNAQALIGAYQTGFYICMGVAILGFLCAAFIFFKFDIRTIFGIRTGRAAKRTIEKMAEVNAMTGRLHREDMDFTTGGLHVKTSTVESGPATTPLQQSTAPDESGKAISPAVSPVQVAEVPGFCFTITKSVMLIHTTEQL